MNNPQTIEYKGYIAEVTVDFEDDILVGRVVNTSDPIAFHGEDARELKQHFKEAIDDYIENCKELGISPDKPCNGSILVRLSPALQADIDRLAARQGVSRNALVVKQLERAVEEGNGTYVSPNHNIIITVNAKNTAHDAEISGSGFSSGVGASITFKDKVFLH